MLVSGDTSMVLRTPGVTVSYKMCYMPVQSPAPLVPQLPCGYPPVLNRQLFAALWIGAARGSVACDRVRMARI